MKLIMSGGGDSEHFVDLDAHFLSLLSSHPNLLFVPLANEPKEYQHELERIASVFSTIHFDSIDMMTNINDLTWDYLKNFDAIYIDGGNTFRLMKQVHNSHFYELVKRFLFHGGVVNGDSAGAIILGSHLETAHFGDSGDENLSSLISYQGLNLLGDWAIHCHYQAGQEDHEIENFVSEYGFPVIALAEPAGISIIDQRVTIVGNADVTFFGGRDRITLSPNQHLDLNFHWNLSRSSF